jgi:BirA family transcriptional regulator, biotin operon repressor / biotin---[acetyl-CoA-carboxylase] ligase
MAEFPPHAGGIAVVALEAAGSTNAEALDRAKAGERGPLWVVARRQSAGRGRRGRVWISEPGNLYASLLLTDAAPARAVSGICFVAALALHDTLLEAVPGLAPEDLKLKWPNDVLLCGKKLAGILVEGMTVADVGMATTVGIGVNCRRHPADAEFPATDLAASGFAIDPEFLLEGLGRSMIARLTAWRRGESFAAIRSAWLARASGIGSAIEVRLADKRIAGTFDAIDQSGALVLRRGDGTRETIAAGDVFPLTAA